jgi:hypothetical protein
VMSSSTSSTSSTMSAVASVAACKAAWYSQRLAYRQLRHRK